MYGNKNYGPCRMYGRDVKYIQNLLVNLKGRDHLGNLGQNAKTTTIIKMDLKK